MQQQCTQGPWLVLNTVVTQYYTGEICNRRFAFTCYAIDAKQFRTQEDADQWRDRCLDGGRNNTASKVVELMISEKAAIAKAKAI